MSQPCRLISWSMALHTSGPRELNSSPTAENMLLFTALATCGHVGPVQGRAHKKLPGITAAISLVWPRLTASTHPVEAGFSAELVGLGGAEVIVRPEGLVECCDEVEEGLPATLVTQRVVSVLAASPQPTHTHTRLWRLLNSPWWFEPLWAATLTVKGWWRWWTVGERAPPGHVAPPPGRTAWTYACRPLPSCRSSSRSCRGANEHPIQNQTNNGLHEQQGRYFSKVSKPQKRELTNVMGWSWEAVVRWEGDSGLYVLFIVTKFFPLSVTLYSV